MNAAPRVPANREIMRSGLVCLVRVCLNRAVGFQAGVNGSSRVNNTVCQGGQNGDAEANNSCGNNNEVNSYGAVFVLAEVFDKIKHCVVPLSSCEHGVIACIACMRLISQ